MQTSDRNNHNPHTHMSKKIPFLALLLWCMAAASPVLSQEKSDTMYLFRFVANDDMFYVPWKGNGEELERLIACVTQNSDAILNSPEPVRVDGHCDSQPTAVENLAMAKIRSNRVKTEMILRGGLTEACFKTRNHTSGGNFVTVRITVPANRDAEAIPSAEDSAACKAEAERLQAEQAEAERLAREAEARAEAERPAEQKARQQARQEAEAERLAAGPSETQPGQSECGFALRANLLRWATLTPDLGIEWRFADRWSIGVNGTWTLWSWNGKERRYALWEVAPEARCYLGEKKRLYLGLMFKAGQFNYKLSDNGRQGNIMGGGISCGYRLGLNEALALDFGITLGGLHAETERYSVIDGVRVRNGQETKSWWGPVNAGINLVWYLF